GRRMYETMIGWETMGEDGSLPDYILEFARIWKEKPKVVVSRTLASAKAGCRLGRDVGEEIARLKNVGDIGVGGPGIAAAVAELGLLDEYRMVLSPVIVGGGKTYFPALRLAVPLSLVETRRFASGAVYLRYRRV
ncbi:MAG TPA: dihydrofolate reductase family protein, partial [Spirochaetia bacterium]